jgi:rhodanese-related sulfurtransferase
MKTKIKILLIFVLAVIAFSACESESSEILPGTAEKAVQSEIKQVSVEQARTAVKGGNAQFIDVRTTEEYAGGHAPKAVNLPLDALETELSKLDKDKPVYVICQTGRRSQKGAEILNKAGFKDIYNIQGGTSAWTSAGFPIEK